MGPIFSSKGSIEQHSSSTKSRDVNMSQRLNNIDNNRQPSITGPRDVALDKVH